MTEVISKVIPILLLIGFGYYLQVKKIADKHTMAMVKKAVINIALPAVLFITFKNMDLRLEYFFISVTVFCMLILFYFVGSALNMVKAMHHTVLPFLTTGYSFGLLAIPLFGAVYGIENLGIISIFGVAHELFIWFVYLTLLKGKLGGQRFTMEIVRKFFESPIILSILIGLFFNLTGWNRFFGSNFLLIGVERTLSYMAATATPVILIVIGYGLHLEHSYMKISYKLLVIRLFVTLTVGYLVKLAIIDPIIGTPGELFNIAYFTFLIMPPPFSLAIFVGEYSTEENMIISNNTTVISTVASIVIFLAATFVA